MGLRGALVVAGLCGWALHAGPGFAQQIVPDATLGADSSQVVTNGFVDVIVGGLENGINLFHSFEEFGIAPGRVATFLSQNRAIENILARVTGTGKSEIFGTLGTISSLSSELAPANVNLFLINPNGIVFGPNSQLDVGASFTATTASGVLWGDSGAFSAMDPSIPEALTVQPSAFFFQRDNAPTAIRVEARQDLEPNNPDLIGLSVPFGNNLMLLGGDIELIGGGVNALGGRVELGAVSGNGKIGLKVGSNLVFPDNLELADIIFTEGARGIVSFKGGGEIIVVSRDLKLSEGSFLSGGISSISGSAEAQAGDIEIRATGDVILEEASYITNNVSLNSRGGGGNIFIEASDLILREDAVITAGTLGNGNAGKISISLTNALILGEPLPVDNGGTRSPHDTQGSFIVNNVLPDAIGDTGGIEIFSRDIKIQGLSQIQSLVQGNGNSGGISITASQNFSLTGHRQVSETRFFPSSIRTNNNGGNGNSGDITIRAHSFYISDRAQISSVINKNGRGSAGNIQITSDEIISLDNSLIISELSEDALNGQGGNIEISARTLELLNGSALLADTESKGKAGNIALDIENSLVLKGLGPSAVDSSNIVGSQISATVEKQAIGQGGDIDITSQKILISDSGFIRTDTFGNGDAGDVVLGVKSLLIENSAGLSANTSSDWNAGRLEVMADEEVVVKDLDSFISADVKTGATGAGGSILVETPVLNLVDNGEISVSTFGQGTPGDIAIETGQLLLEDGFLRTQGQSSDGGDITISSKDVLLMRQASEISTSAGLAEQSGNGGNITINTPFLIGFPGENSDIIANAFEGTGGNITINADAILNFELQDEPNVQTLRSNTTNDISASSAIGSSGVLNLAGLNVDPSRGAAQLPGAPAPITTVDSSCSAQTTGQNSFTVTGRGGLPLSPQEPHSSLADPSPEWIALPASASTTASAVAAPDSQAQPLTAQPSLASPSNSPSALPHLQEASSWQKSANGDVTLIAQRQFFSLPPADCLTSLNYRPTAEKAEIEAQ